MSRIKRILISLVIVVGVALIFLPISFAQDSASSTSNVFDAAMLKKAVEDLGYQPKELSGGQGKEKYEIVVSRGGLTIPIATELSGSRGYIWLTVLLGEAPKEDSASLSKCAALLRSNFQIQPAHFYITTKGSLMCAIPVENRAVTNAVMRRAIDKIANDVVDTKSIWEK